jgi:hypothetical protein
LEIKIYKPKNKILENYIECFYTLQRNDNDENITYFGFPSNTIFLTLCHNAEIIINENDITIENNTNEKIKSILIIDNQKHGATTYRVKTNEISIYFKPLGANKKTSIRKNLAINCCRNSTDFGWSVYSYAKRKPRRQNGLQRSCCTICHYERHNDSNCSLDPFLKS